jgi:tetratricopeptide (TPR) repeat protein
LNAFRFLTKALGLAVPVLYLGIAVPALADEAEEALQRGVELFEAGDYLAAQQALLDIDRDDLSEADGARRDDYLERIQVALTMLEKASKDLEDGETALSHNDLEEAEARLTDVLANEYAPQALRNSAVELLRKVAEKRDHSPEPAAPAPVETAPSSAPATAPMPSPVVSEEGRDFERAAVLIRQGRDALKGGRTQEAIRLFEGALDLVPGHPDAIEGLEQAQSYQEVEAGPQSLLGRMRRSDEIRWQRTVAAYREAERDIRADIMKDRYDLAQPRMIEALQTIEAGRQYARPLAKYESIKAQADALKRYLEDEQRAYEERKVREARDEVEQKRRERNEAVRRARREQVEALMSQAAQHRKNRELPEAIAVLKEVVAIDPQNDRARWMLDDLDDLYQLVHQREIHEEARRGVQGVLTDTEESKVPIDKLLVYPDNWLELISGPERVPPGREHQSPADRNLQAKLDRRIPVDFNGQALAKVLDDLAHETDVNMAVAWNDLESRGIQRNDPVDLRFSTEIPFRKALREVLDQAGGNVKLGFAAKDGLIKVATKEQLDRDVYTEVYPIEDLLMAVPDYNYDGPPFGIQQRHAENIGSRYASATFDRPGGFGEREFDGRERDGRRPRRGHTEDDDERQVRVDDLLELIRNTIEPDSWRSWVGNWL